MLDQLRREYKHQLKRDPSLEFDPEFVRTTNLERELVDKHGFDAIRLIFDDQNSANYYPLGNFPSDCPWAHLNGLNLRSAIRTLFSSLTKKIPTLIETLCDRCQYLYAEKTETSWALHYFLEMMLYDQRRYYEVYTGGPPTPNPEPNSCLVNYGWQIPDDLARLYAIHDGFGPILSNGIISVMAEMLDPICKDLNTYPEGYEFRDLLEFHPDGAGNAQCFHRTNGTITTVDWDHEIWEISGSQDFFSYVDERLSQLDEE